MAELVPYLRGWRGYFGFCETPEVLLGLIRWVRLRLRAALWRQWKPNAVVEPLCWNSGSARGWRVTPLAADLAPGSSHAPRPSLWGFPTPTWNRLVFLRSLTRNGINSRTAVYGPVRTVVWQGSAGDRRPYADLVGDPVVGQIRTRKSSSRHLTMAAACIATCSFDHRC
jgi:group II intron maturase